MAALATRASPMASSFSARSRCATKPSASMCRPRSVIRFYKKPAGSFGQSNVNGCESADCRQTTPQSFRRDALVPFMPVLGLNSFVRNFGDIEKFFNDEFLQPFDQASSERTWQLSTDISETDAAYLLKVDVPGIPKENIKLKVTDERFLVISADRENEKDETDEKTGFVHKERRFGKFSRTMKLPDVVDVSGITAESKDGVLTITLPKNKEQLPKEQEIAVA